MKKISIWLAFGLFFWNISSTYIHAQPIDFDDDFFANIDNDLNSISQNLDTIDQSTLVRSEIDSSLAIYTFFGLMNNPANVLNIPIYQATSPIRNRPILEYPFALTYGFDIKNNNTLSFMLFANFWNHKHYTKNGTTLNTYFDLGNEKRIAQITIADEALELNTAENLAKSLGLFDPATVEERRLGGMLQAHATHKRWNIMVQLPILYTEQNLHLKPWEKAAIAISPIGNALSTDGVDENDFIYDHIVMDQFGFGDLKCKVMHQMHYSNTFNIDLGGFIILPTEKACKQEIIGTWFEQNNQRGYLNLTTINPENVTDQNKDDVANFFLDAVNKLASNILNTPLGNGGFVTIAPSLNFDWYFADNWQFSNDFSLQIPLPKTEPRFYQQTQTTTDFYNDYNKAYQAGPDVFALYVNQELANLFFPYVFPTMVFPGLVFNSTNQFTHSYHDWDFYIGANFWYQGAENIKKPIIPFQQSFQYDYKGAQAERAAQEKLFIKINWNSQTTNYSWLLSLYGDISIWNCGIGNDYTLGINVDCKF